jgi:hypothetical protein
MFFIREVPQNFNAFSKHTKAAIASTIAAYHFHHMPHKGLSYSLCGGLFLNILSHPL